MGEIEHYTTAEAGERLRLKPDSVAKKIKRGDLKAIKVGKHWLIPKETLDAMLAATSAPG